ncbi:Armadillo-type fold [Babesia duncani]|uniref:Armadillo-type fold n=1 Tax=Babesia duncani TaxID=323732 RepID=A0AAD9PNJ0_9APIC|nr:Armadillo-type fold [Babesia duncani]
MEKYVGRIFQVNTNDWDLENELELKFSNLKEKIVNNEKTYVEGTLQGTLLDQVLEPLFHGDARTVKKSLLVINFIVKLDYFQYEHGLPVTEKSADYYEEVLSALLKYLEIFKDPTSMERPEALQSLTRHFQYLLEPQVANVFKFHKRFANLALDHIIKGNDSSEEAELLLITILTWICRTRCLDEGSGDSEQLIDTLWRLQASKNESVSENASILLLKNLVKLTKREDSTVHAFVENAVENIKRDVLHDKQLAFKRVQILVVMFKMGSTSQGIGYIYPRTIWGVIKAIIKETTEDNYNEIVREALHLMVAYCSMIGPDVLVCLVPNISEILNNLTSDDKLLDLYTNDIVDTIDTIGYYCPNLYVAMEPSFDKLLEQAKNILQINEDEEDVKKGDISKLQALINVIRHLMGTGTGPEIESLILSIMSAAIGTREPVLVAMANLVIEYIGTCPPIHAEFLSVLINFLSKASQVYTNPIFVRAVLKVQRYMHMKKSGRRGHYECESYTKVLQALLEPKEKLQRPKINDEEVVEMVKDKLKRMRNQT